MIPWNGSTPGLHPTMVPSSVAKRNRLGPDFPFSETSKLPDPLKTVPVGAPPGTLPGAGIWTTSPRGVAAPLAMPYRVLTPALLSAAQIGLPELDERPQGFFRWGSVTGAIPGMFDTRLLCR